MDLSTRSSPKGPGQNCKKCVFVNRSVLLLGTHLDRKNTRWLWDLRTCDEVLQQATNSNRVDMIMLASNARFCFVGGFPQWQAIGHLAEVLVPSLPGSRSAAFCIRLVHSQELCARSQKLLMVVSECLVRSSSCVASSSYCQYSSSLFL